MLGTLHRVKISNIYSSNLFNIFLKANSDNHRINCMLWWTQLKHEKAKLYFYFIKFCNFTSILFSALNNWFQNPEMDLRLNSHTLYKRAGKQVNENHMDGVIIKKKNSGVHIVLVLFHTPPIRISSVGREQVVFCSCWVFTLWKQPNLMRLWKLTSVEHFKPCLQRIIHLWLDWQKSAS